MSSWCYTVSWCPWVKMFSHIWLKVLGTFSKNVLSLNYWDKKGEKSYTKHLLLILQKMSWIYLNVMDPLSVLKPENIWVNRSLQLSSTNLCSCGTGADTKEGFVESINISLSVSASVDSVHSEIAFAPQRLVKCLKSTVTWSYNRRIRCKQPFSFLWNSCSP